MTDTNYKFEVGKEHKTRGGYVATVLDVNFNGYVGRGIIGKVKIHGHDEILRWQLNGFYLAVTKPHDYDLMPPVETKELWVNVYGDVSSSSWSKKTVANTHAANGRIGLLKITIIGDDYEVEKAVI